MFGRIGKPKAMADPAGLEAAGDSEGLAHLLGTADDPGARKAAAAGLGRIGGVRATVALRAALADIDTSVRIEAVNALGAIRGPRAADALLDALRGADRDVRGAALSHLAELGDPRVLPTLIEMAQNPRSPLRRAAISALGGFKDSAAIDTLLAAAIDRDGVVSDLACTALGRVGGRQAVKTLLRVRTPSAARALGRIGHPSAVDGLIQTLGNVRSEVLRASAASALQAIHQSHPDLRLDAMARTGGEVRQLAACGDPRAAAPLCSWLFAPDPTDRVLACRGLALLGDSSILSLLQEQLKDPQPEVCRAASEAIQALDPQDGWDPLSETIVQHMTRIEQLGSDPGAVDDLVASVHFLGRLGATLALPTLHGLEAHPDWNVRNAVAEALKAITLLAARKGT